MRKDMTTTPRSRVKNAIRMLWLRSRERAMAIKLAGNTCKHCNLKGSKKKGHEVDIQAHHTKGIDWDGVVDLIIARVLQRPEDYEILCKHCHENVHSAGKHAKEPLNVSTSNNNAI